ncbi:hypothetical protein [Acinetobacter lwoffii]|uniref:hypothetical protein n=1 Tax=Acinetobacter lwoffii TaxID=28090 RepID=UPI00209A9ECB|nr:hypothetical protein [Acinetobacter lwoffii]MCO8080808.1 hypothetical protein [Acinetobacter lwoffii]
MASNFNQYQLNKTYNRFLLKLIAWNIFNSRNNPQKADEQAVLILEMLPFLDLDKLEKYQSHFPLVDSHKLINKFMKRAV